MGYTQSEGIDIIQGPRRYDIDENQSDVDPKFLPDKKVWVPFIPLPSPLDEY